jgi:UDP-2-acetamido-2-deoxy-ribo-hexuluronate aminotransferase
MDFVNLKAQQFALKAEIDKRISDVLHHGRYIMGPEVEELEETLKKFTNSKYCITVSSGTDALTISLMALGVGPGDEVITTPFSFISTSEAIVNVGAKPVFVDIEIDTCNIDSSQIESKITNRTKAILPVSLYGQPSDMDQINKIAKKYKIPVVEDAAQSFGAEYKARKSCNLSDIGCTSFFPSKPLGCYGDGGAIFTNDEKLANACKEIRVHGQSKRYVHNRVGLCGRMDTIQCAIVLAKFDKFDWELRQRIYIGKRYNEALDSYNIQRIQQRSNVTSVFGQYTILSNNRKDLQRFLQNSNIPTIVHYPVPINEQQAYSDQSISSTFSAIKASKEVLSLPMSAYLTEAEQDFVIKKLGKYIQNNSNQ